MADSHQMFIDGEWVNSSDGGTRDMGGLLEQSGLGLADDQVRLTPPRDGHGGHDRTGARGELIVGP